MAPAKQSPGGLALSTKEALVLAILAQGGEMYGLEIVAASDGELRRGTVYVTLGRMEAKGYVEVRSPPKAERTSGMPRPRYRATALGLRLLDAARAYSRAFARVKGTT
jgi:DNA-binding PadR family transcriptional regulator